jgi:hypothetical protein
MLIRLKAPHHDPTVASEPWIDLMKERREILDVGPPNTKSVTLKGELLSYIKCELKSRIRLKS